LVIILSKFGQVGLHQFFKNIFVLFLLDIVRLCMCSWMAVWFLVSFNVPEVGISRTFCGVE